MSTGAGDARRRARVRAISASALMCLLASLIAPPVATAYVDASHVASGTTFTCILTPTAAADCWGAEGAKVTIDQAGPFTEIAAGGYHACALTPAKAADCWGANFSGQAMDQAGPFTHVAAGTYHSCGLTPAGAADCWGANDHGQATDQAGHRPIRSRSE